MRYGSLFFFVVFAAFIAATVYGYSYYMKGMRGQGSALRGVTSHLRGNAKAPQSSLRTLARGRDPYNNGGEANAKQAAKDAEALIIKMQKKR